MNAEPIVVSLVVGFIMASVIVGVCGADETWGWLCGLVGLPPTFTQDVGASDGDWCAGCDQIVPRSRMAWDDGRYRCDLCLNPPPPKRGVTDGGAIKVDLDWITEGTRKPAKKTVAREPGDAVGFADDLIRFMTSTALFGVVCDD